MIKTNSRVATALPPVQTPIMAEQFVIRSVEMRCVAPIEFKRPFHDATMGPFQQYQPCFVRLTDQHGAWGECEFPISELYLLKNIFAPLLLNTPHKTYETLYRTLYWNIRNEGFRGGAALALGHLDRAFYDLAARRQGVPVFRYLGGKNPRVKAYASGGSTHLKGNELLEECLAWEEQGYTTIKMKFGSLTSTIEEDLKRIAQVREALRPDTRLAVDANQSISLAKALILSQELATMNIAWLEEPVHSAALHEIEELCAHSSVPISYGESERSAEVFPSLIRAGVQHLQPIAGHISSISDWLSLAALAHRNDLAFSSGGTSHINASLVAAAGKEAQLEYLEPVVGAIASLLCVRPDIQNGHFILPEVPGIGADVDWARVEKEKRIIDQCIWN